MRKAYTFHSREEKLTIVKRYLLGKPPKIPGRELGISDGNIRKWKRQYLSSGESALENPSAISCLRICIPLFLTLDYFNIIRPIRKLNGKPPVQFRIEQVA